MTGHEIRCAWELGQVRDEFDSYNSSMKWLEKAIDDAIHKSSTWYQDQLDRIEADRQDRINMYRNQDL